jgi:hypothetical protein
MPGSKPGSRHTSQDFTQQVAPAAWVATEQTTLDYTNSLTYLKNGTKVITLLISALNFKLIFSRYLNSGLMMRMCWSLSSRRRWDVPLHSKSLLW